ncbi:Immunoglobulin subtype,Immunoglobulin-like domain,Immunoglobulin-like fold,Leucine-rich repeat [Cinara cedri]|uniref:Immunoglobulin subtype,Immunoglobulin-like domain,Immunoglobulin-like fold,Leucine-rich repeat n=1 Tax=Cinara cedri TaxID=506608 RepID=A0A5E4MU62_9HEMI|nr:Immunoglobulin subtype,Immunoglobulin-like domain,Immunoglobulin-like fold,Leucine-rich repeat [Cinara cedri]
MPRRRVAPTMVIFVTAALAVILAGAAGCPLGCTCKWKGGKQTVECVNRSLSAIPSGMDAGTQVLDMSGNPLDTLSYGRFMNAGLSNLQKIYMARCRITYVDDAAFHGLSNLVELDLSDNGIADIPTKSFDDYPQLMKLVLSGNVVTVIRTAAFSRLIFLTVLDISRCRLSTIEPGAFDNLRSLEWLRLDNNLIARIESTGGAVLPLSLHGIEMHNNPWKCDCHLRDVHRWLNNNTAPHTMEPKCHEPDRLQGSTIRKLATEDLACSPVAATKLPSSIETDAGKNVTLTCVIIPAGEARISWWFEGQPMANGTGNGAELTIDDVGPADNGTYVCVAENRAGRASCNFTLRVVQEVSEVAAGSYPPDRPAPAFLVGVLAAGAVCFVVVAVVCAVGCRLIVVKRRRRRSDDRGRSGKSNGTGSGGISGDETANGQVAKPSSDIRQSDSVNLTVSSTVDGKLSSAEDVSVYGEYDGSTVAAGNAPGAAAAYEVHEVLHVTGGGYDAYRAHAVAGHPSTTTLEANPDLISDASTVVRDNSGDYHDGIGEVYKISVPPLPGGREFWTNAGTIVYPSGGGGDSYELQLSPGKLAAGEPYPADYGLPKMQQSLNPAAVQTMAYPPDYGLPKIQMAPVSYPVPPPTLYQTLPHRRNAAKPQGRSCQEAEFVLLQQQHHPHHHHHRTHQQQQQQSHQQQQQQQHNQHHLHQMRYEPQNVRYNQQGYPYHAADAGAYYTTAFYDPPAPLLSNASAQTLDEESMMMMMMPPSSAAAGATASALSAVGRQQQQQQQQHQHQLPAEQQQLHKAVTSVQKQPANTESPDEGYVGEGPDS